MGISAAMSTKERKQILSGLIDQGATVVRDGNHGTILNLKNGGRFTVPVGTSDHKARLAMRSQVRRLGYHWPLDPPEKKKENPVARELPTIEENGEQVIVPLSVQRQLETYPLPKESTYRVAEPLLREFADTTLWTNELSDRLRDKPGYANPSAAIRLASFMLWFAGFRVINTKVNRNGFDYQWKRKDDLDWPTVFATEKPFEAINAARRAARDTIGADDDNGFRVSPDEAATVDEQPTDEDTELSLALEQEQRANRAERLAETRRVDLENEKSAHAGTRRDLMTRIAGWERKVVMKDGEIARLRSLLEERTAADREGVGEPSLLRRAKVAEDAVKSLTDDVADLKARLASAEDAANTAARAVAGQPRVTSRLSVDEWWPIEPSAGQTVEQLIAAGPMFGLEVRLQARRK